MIKGNGFKLLVFSFIALFINLNVVNAKCSYEEEVKLNAQASNMKFKYEIAEYVDEGEGDEIPLTETYIQINIYNLTKDLKVEMESVKDKESRTFTFKDSKDGVIKIPIRDIQEIQTFNFNIYPINTECSDKALRVNTLVLPKFNRYANLAVCEETPDFYLCQKFITNHDEITFKKFTQERDKYLKEVEKKKQAEDEKNSNKFLNFIKKNKWIFISVGAVLIAGTTIVIIKKKRSKAL